MSERMLINGRQCGKGKNILYNGQGLAMWLAALHVRPHTTNCPALGNEQDLGEAGILPNPMLNEGAVSQTET